MGTRADIALRAADAFRQRLKDEGHHRDAEIVRALCQSFRASRSLNSVLHRENMELRGGYPPTEHSGLAQADMTGPGE